jgi:hypothetical protein
LCGKPALKQEGIMTWVKIAGLVLFAATLACGQILFKAAAQSIKGRLALMLKPFFN